MNDFLITIENSDSLKELFNKITENNVYNYWCDKNELEKIFSNKETEYSYLSFYFLSKFDKINELVNNGYILIFLKKPKILFGIIKAETVIIKNLLKNNYLEEEDLNYNNEIMNNRFILIDENKYNELLKQYKIIEIPKMFFVKFKHIYEFKFEISIKKFNEYIKNKYLETRENEFKYPKNLNNNAMTKSYNKNIIYNLQSFINNSFDYNSNLDKQESDIKSNLSLDNEKTNKNVGNLKFCIPVLWNYCDTFKKELDNLETNKKIKKFFILHYTNCSKCEINDNNYKLINLLDKKIVFNYLNSDFDINIFDKVIYSYKNTKNLLLFDDTDNLKLRKECINIIYCPKSKSIYKNCLFIIQ